MERYFWTPINETFGMFGWKRSHQSIDGNLYCTVEIRDRETGEWISKQDVGTTGYAEKEKSQASDSFKRACFNWGIGRELYSAPFIWIPASKVQIQKKENKFYCSDSFCVASITYSESREIAGLQIASGRGGILFEWKMQDRKSGKKDSSREESVKKEPVQKSASGKCEIMQAESPEDFDCDACRSDFKDFVPMYVLSNRYRVEGATCILYTGLLSDICDRLESSFYIIPSSIHETLILPIDNTDESEEIRAMIKEVNDTHVSAEDILSYSLYFYDKKEHRLYIV